MKMKLIDFAKKAKRRFARDYLSDTILFSIYDSFKFSYPKYVGIKLSDILVYKNKKNVEFYLLEEEDEMLEDILEEKIKPKFVKKIIVEFSKKVEETEKTLAKKNPSIKDRKKLFILDSELFPLEMIVFLVPHLVLEHGVKMADKKLVAYCQEARKKTEKLSYAVDAFFKQQEAVVPKYIKGYKKNLPEFIIFNNKVISDKSNLRKLKKLLETGNKKTKNTKLVKGFTAYIGRAKGLAKVIFSRKDYKKIKKGDILVTANTNPDYLPAIKKAAAIVTDEGGITSHAAIVAREFKIPCIVGTKNATKILKTGDFIKVDAGEGIVHIIKRARR